MADGFVPGDTLVSIEEAARQGSVVQNLLSDAGQVATWPLVSCSDGFLKSSGLASSVIKTSAPTT